MLSYVRKSAVVWNVLKHRPFRQKPHLIHDNEWREFVEWHWQGNIDILGGKPVPVPLFPLQISNEMAWDRTRASPSSLKKSESTFLYSAPRFTKQHSFLEGFHVRSLCFSVKSNMYIKMSMQHWRNDTDRENRSIRKKKPVSGPLCPPKISHGVTWNRAQASAVKGRQVSAWTTTSKTEINLHYVERTSSYLAVNIFCDQSRKLRGEIMAVYCQNHGTHEFTVPL